MSTPEEKWDYRFMRLALETKLWSKDPNKRVGCVIISPDRRQVSYGYNGFPKNVADTDERLKNKEVKNSLTIHAELNAILNSRQSLDGWTLYVTNPPCKHCALAIIQSGITRVVTTRMDLNSSWASTILEAQGLFAEAGIQYTEY